MIEVSREARKIAQICWAAFTKGGLKNWLTFISLIVVVVFLLLLILKDVGFITSKEVNTTNVVANGNCSQAINGNGSGNTVNCSEQVKIEVETKKVDTAKQITTYSVNILLPSGSLPEGTVEEPGSCSPPPASPLEATFYSYAGQRIAKYTMTCPSDVLVIPGQNLKWLME